MPSTQQHGTRTPNPCTDKDDRGPESLVQFPLQPQDPHMTTPQETTQHSSLATLLVVDSYQNSESPDHDPKHNPPTSPLPYPVPQNAAPAKSPTTPLQAPSRRITLALEDKSLKGKHILFLPPLHIIAMTTLAFILYLLWCN
ncbi:hypothetical protein HOY82DRAFT_593244 [Tuber indicum]|nr:hypothetical protein HOY82DRAFT_593244 [Tuber indicum]